MTRDFMPGEWVRPSHINRVTPDDGEIIVGGPEGPERRLLADVLPTEDDMALLDSANVRLASLEADRVPATEWTATKAEAVRADSRVFDVRAFGGVAGTSAVDNIAAINAAIAAAHGAGGGEVFIPDGTWYIDPAPGNVVNIGVQSNVTFRGVGGASRIKVVDDAGDYRWLFCPADPVNTTNAYVENVTFRDLVIDHNASGNTTCNINGGSAGQATFAFNNFTNLTIDTVTLDPYTGTNPIRVLGSPYSANTLKITNCHFHFERGASTESPDGRYDTSTIYASASNVIVANNTFTYDGPDPMYPDGAIEIHGPLSVVQGNIIENFGVGTWLVAHTNATLDKDTLGITCTGNIYRRCGFGIGCFPAAAAHANDEIVIADNIIHLDTASKPYRITPGGIYLGDNAYGDVVENVLVHDNIITCMPGDLRTTATGGAAIQWSVGCIHITGKVTTRVVTVHDNIIEGFGGPGIRIAGGAGVAYEDIWIHHNTVKNCGANSATTASNRAGISVTGSGEYKGCVIEDNLIIDTGTPGLTGQYGWRVSALTGTNKDVTIRRIEQRALSGTLTDLNSATGSLRVDTGLTSQRPTAAIARKGFQYFDTTLNRPIWSDGSAWRDASGTVV